MEPGLQKFHMLIQMLRKYENGFRSSRFTAAQILTLRRLIEGIKAKKLSAVITFLDFKKAFDSIHRGKLMEILLVYCISAIEATQLQKFYH